MNKRFGALEAGGTKMVCALGDETGRVLEQVSFPTTFPDETMPPILDYFRGTGIAALGIGCFGPVDPDKASPDWGHILETPKPGWQHYDMAGVMKKALNVPVGFDTDVNASLLGEVTFGSSRGLQDVVYITIGTGVGAGILSGGKPVHGMLHPEAGHIRLQVLPGDTYAGKCPFHGTCLEGLASGPAIEGRWGKPAKELKDRPEVWELEAGYIAQAVTSMIMILSPSRFILGGGVMHQQQLFPLIRNKVRDYIAGYLKTRELEDMDSYIIPASLNDDQGIMGAFKLAMDALNGD